MKKFLISVLIMLFLPVFSNAKDALNTHVDVAFTIDNNYPIFTMILMDSILNNSKANYTFWVVENNITNKNKEKMRKYVESKHQQIEFINIDTNKIDDGDNLFGFSNYITSIGFARILLPDLLPKTVHKVLYLDSDMLATGDISKLYNIPLDDKIAGMVLNIVEDNYALSLYNFKNGYYNSGMILMNLDMCRKENSPAKMINFVKKNKEKFMFDENNNETIKWVYPDQDLINIVWDGRIKNIPAKWNNQCIRKRSMDNMYSGGIIHYIGPSKPWDFEGTLSYEYVKIYFDYWKHSPFSKYRYYYFCKKFVNNYTKMIKKKMKRYNIFFENVKNKSKIDSIMFLFYVPEKMKR